MSLCSDLKMSEDLRRFEVPINPPTPKVEDAPLEFEGDFEWSDKQLQKEAEEASLDA